MWLLAQQMAGAEKDMSEQIQSIDDEIGRFEERSRLTKEFWKIRNREGKDLSGLDDMPDTASGNRYERLTFTPKVQRGIEHDRNRNKETVKQEREKVANPPRNATPSKIPAARRIPPQFFSRAPSKTCQIETMTTATRVRTDPSRVREIASPSRHLESMLVASTYAAGSKIRRVNFLT